MVSKIPIIVSSIDFKELTDSLLFSRSQKTISEFACALSNFFKSRYIFLTNYGVSSLYIILLACKEMSSKREVVLPAYGPGSLVRVVTKAGLKPVLCDISLNDFNIDMDLLSSVVSSNTLAIVLVHLFGVPIPNIDVLKQKLPQDIFLIEDCAQAMGTLFKGKTVGSFTDASFFSFNRGKNLPLCAGGCIATNSSDIAKVLNSVYLQHSLCYGYIESLFFLFKVLGFSLATKPLLYGLGYPIISRFKDTAPVNDFKVTKISRFQASLGLSLLKKADILFRIRHKNGIYLFSSLKGIEGLLLPQIPEYSWTVFNRFPIVFKEISKRKKAEEKLWNCGIETSGMYLRPLHHMFNLGQEKDYFPHSVYLAPRLLTVPVHPLISDSALDKIITTLMTIL